MKHGAVTIIEHAHFRRSITKDPERIDSKFDDIDHAVAEAEEILNPRSARETNRVLQILDEIEGQERRGA